MVKFQPFFAATCILLAAMSGANGQPAGKSTCPIFPVPKEYRVKDGGPVALRGPVAIVLGAKAGEPEKFAASRLAYVLKKRFGLDAPVVTETTVPKKAASLLILGTLDSSSLLKSLKDKHAVGLDALKGKDPMQDAFAIEALKGDDRRVVLMIGSTERSVIYAQYAFLATLTREGKDVLHPDLSVRDWSSLRYRDWWPGDPKYFADTAGLDEITYARANMTHFRTKKSGTISRDTVKECWRRGLRPYGFVYGAIPASGHPYAVRETKAWLDKGCYGIYISFDDFGMGGDPEGLCNKVTSLIKKRFGEVGDRITFVASHPDYYFLNMGNNRRIRNFKDCKEGIFYFTGPHDGAFNTKQHFDGARAAGIRNYIWWHNYPCGPRGFFTPARANRYYALLPFNRNCWGRFTFDSLRRGGEHLTGMSAQNEHFHYVALQLFWAWDPAHYTYEKARTAIYRERHGAAAVETVRKLEDNMYKLTDHFTVMWRNWAVTSWMLLDDTKRKEALALIDEMQEQLNAIKAGKKVSYMPEEAYEREFVKPLEVHLDAGRRLASTDFPDYAVRKREGRKPTGHPRLLQSGAPASLQKKIVALLQAGKQKEAEAYLADLRKEAEPMLERIEKELKDLWYTQEYLDTWRGMLRLKHWEPIASRDFTRKTTLAIRRNAEGKVVMETNRKGSEILYALDGPPPTEGAGRVYSGPISIPGSRLITAVVRQKGSGMTSHVFQHHLGVPKTDWRVVYTDSDDGKDAAGANVIDGSLETAWISDRTRQGPRHPHQIQIDMGRKTEVHAVAFYTRRHNGRGVPKRYQVYASDDSNNWGDSVAEGEFDCIAPRMVIGLKKAVNVRYLRLVFLSDFRGVHFTAITEIDGLQFAPRPAVKPAGALQSGLRYQCYETEPLWFWRAPMDRDARKSGVVAVPMLEIEGRRDQHYAVLYEGYIKIPVKGVYTFSLSSDDGSVMWLNDEKFITNDGRHPGTARSNGAILDAGCYRIRLGYFQAVGGTGLRVTWQPPGKKRELLPADVLFHAGGE